MMNLSLKWIVWTNVFLGSVQFLTVVSLSASEILSSS